MKRDNPLWKQYRNSLLVELEQFKGLIRQIQQEYTLSNVITLKKFVQRLQDNAQIFGYKEAAEICQELKWDLIGKEKNFYLFTPPPDWSSNLDTLFEKIEKAYHVEDEEEMTAMQPEKEKKRKVVVVVDDDPDIIKLLEYEFLELGYEVQSFQKGLEAQSYLLSQENMTRTSLLILDRILPDMDGLDILIRLNKEVPQHCPVLILSALGSESDIISGLQGGGG